MITCDRCGNSAGISIVSYFNLDRLCIDCSKKERAHPMFQHARDVEERHVRSGDLNFRGIGLPADLVVRRG